MIRKKPKNRNVTIKMHLMWNVKQKVRLVIIGLTGIISTSFRNYLSKTAEKHEFKEITDNRRTEHGTHT